MLFCFVIFAAAVSSSATHSVSVQRDSEGNQFKKRFFGENWKQLFDFLNPGDATEEPSASANDADASQNPISSVFSSLNQHLGNHLSDVFDTAKPVHNDLGSPLQQLIKGDIGEKVANSLDAFRQLQSTLYGFGVGKREEAEKREQIKGGNSYLGGKEKEMNQMIEKKNMLDENLERMEEEMKMVEKGAEEKRKIQAEERLQKNEKRNKKDTKTEDVVKVRSVSVEEKRKKADEMKRQQKRTFGQTPKNISLWR